jgi:cell wall-associated NlpC family hydrolase
MSAVEAMGRISQIQSTIRSLTQPSAQQAMGVAVLGSGTATSAAGASLATTSTTSAVQALTGASASTGTSQDFATQLAALSGAAAVAPTPAPATGPTGADLVAEARKYVGVPYVWGGATPQGLDCSGLVKLSLSALGVDMPRVAREQMTQGTHVASLDQAEPGDLLVFDGGSHIGIYLGEGRMIDAPKPGDRVRERDVYETPTAIRRVLPTASEAAAAAAAAAPALSTAAQVEQLLASSAADRSSMTALLGDAA